MRTRRVCMICHPRDRCMSPHRAPPPLPFGQSLRDRLLCRRCMLYTWCGHSTTVFRRVALCASVRYRRFRNAGGTRVGAAGSELRSHPSGRGRQRRVHCNDRIGRGYNPEDLERYFRSLGVPMPEVVVAVPVSGARNAPTGDPGIRSFTEANIRRGHACAAPIQSTWSDHDEPRHRFRQRPIVAPQRAYSDGG